MANPNKPTSDQEELSKLPEGEQVAKEVREDVDTLVSLDKLKVTAFYEDLEAAIPEVAAMKGFDQRSDFHSLTLDEHTKELVRNLEQDSFVQNHPKRDLILLAGQLHDLGKVSPEGQQIHPKDPEKRQYVGHESESERISSEVMGKHMDLSESDAEFVSKLTGLHASALNMIDSIGGKLFKNTDRTFELDGDGNLIPQAQTTKLKGKDLKSFDKFLKKVEEIPGDLSLEEKMLVVFALNMADKSAGWNEDSDQQDEKVQGIMEKSDRQVKVLSELKKALSALLQAIEARRSGAQTAGIKLENGEYAAINTEVPNKEKKAKAEIPAELKKLGGVLRDKMRPVAEVYATLQGKKDNERALQGIVNGMLKKKIGLSDEQVAAVLELLK